MQTTRLSPQILLFANQSRRDEVEIVPDETCKRVNDAPVSPLAIECRGRKWAVVRFSRPLDAAPGCATPEDAGISYLIGVSHARLWFVLDGHAVEPVRHGFTRHGTELDIMPWETPAAALRRQTSIACTLPPTAVPLRPSVG